MQVFAGSSAATSGARCSSRGEISSEPALISSWSAAPAEERSVALAGYDIGLVQEPEAAVLLQDLARSVEVMALAEHFAQAMVVDLRHVDRGIPRREQGRSADAARDLARQRMHVVAEQRPGVGVGVEVVAPRLLAQLGFRRAQQV